MKYSSTIVAISSAPGAGIRGIIRLSGPDSFLEVEKLLDTGNLPRKFSARTTSIQIPHLPPFPALVLLLPSPHSYTTEDMVEIHCPGSPLLLEEVLAYFLSQTISLAEPGEFTRRAFLNGRIDLLQAEGVLQLIESSSTEELRQAQVFLSHDLGLQMSQCAQILKEWLAGMHASMDFPDDEVASPDDLFFPITRALDLIRDGRRSLGRTASQSRATLALWGWANVGKSLLFNRLTQGDGALVSPVEFTTRDEIYSSIPERKSPLNLLDLACFRPPQNKMEELAQHRSRQKMEEARLVVFVLDGSRSLREEERRELEELIGRNRPVLVVKNKEDLSSPDFDPPPSLEILEVSALKNQGLSKLVERAESFLDSGHFQEGGLLSHRQREIYQRAQAGLEQALDHKEELDLAIFEVEEALEALGELTGKVVNDQILDLIFSQFCIGK